jgi:hypothetical protein
MPQAATPHEVRVFYAEYRPRVLGALLTVGCTAGVLWPLLHGLREPIAAGVRLGVVLAMWVACARLFQRQASYRLEVGPAGLCIQRGPNPISFTWDAFDSFGAPQARTLVLRTRNRQLVTLTGWRDFETLAPLVTSYLEKALVQKGEAPPTQH